MIQDYLAPVGLGFLIVVGMLTVAYVVGRGLAKIERWFASRKGE